MMAFLGLVAVAGIALVAFIITTASTIGFLEILGIAIFGFVAAVAILAFAACAIAKYTGHKVKNRIRDIRVRVKRLKK